MIAYLADGEIIDRINHSDCVGLRLADNVRHNGRARRYYIVNIRTHRHYCACRRVLTEHKSCCYRIIALFCYITNGKAAIDNR